MSKEEPPITDLRSALQRLARYPRQLIETGHPVDPNGELAGVYRRIGAGGTVERPTRIGPAMLFNSVTGYPDVRVLVGLTASRERVGILFGSPPNGLAQRMSQAYDNAIAPVKFSGDQAPCQQVVYRADEPGFDLRTILPAPTNTDVDAGPYFCLGLVLGSDPELGTDVTIHRLCVQGPDEMSIFFAPSRHIDALDSAPVRPCSGGTTVGAGRDHGDDRPAGLRHDHEFLHPASQLGRAASMNVTGHPADASAVPPRQSLFPATGRPGPGHHPGRRYASAEAAWRL
jgi:hypothetical protein